MDNPLVSVLMVVKNGERFLPSAIDSMMKQEISSMETIVVDGQSVDGTAEITRLIQRVHYIYQPDHGLANARNCAIRAARGEFIAFLDSDDIWASKKIKTQLEYLNSHLGILGTVTWLRFIMEPGLTIHDRVIENHYKHDMIGYTPSALVARRDLFRQVGFFDPAFSLGCDADWFARLLDSHLQISIIPEVLLYKRIHDSNLSRNIAQTKKETMLVLRNSLIRKRGKNATYS
jgi:glycosyltransferase involved in cell wall biosynthesis